MRMTTAPDRRLIADDFVLVIAAIVAIGESCVNRRRTRRRSRTDDLLALRRVLAHADSRDPARPLADTQFEIRRQDEIRVHDNVAFSGEFAVGVRQKLDVPARSGVFKRSALSARKPGHLGPEPRLTVVARELLVEGPRRLSLQTRNDAFEPRVFGG